MKQCWRWFGPDDPILLKDLHQVGVQGIVTALHDIPPGAVWSENSIRTRMEMINADNLSWDVVESLPVSETIKTQGSDFKEHISSYRESLRNLAAQGIETVCYNFMPILDWTRTQLRKPQPHGGTAMHFSLQDFAVFDLFILKRTSAVDDYSKEQQAIASVEFASLDERQKKELVETIIAGLPGANDNWTLSDVAERLATYDGIDPETLRNHLIDFLSEVAPLAEDLGLRLCCHPDDPPFPLLGLPRVMSSLDDYAAILNAVDTPANGATLCTGSLGVSESFDPSAFISKLGDRVHFAHLRNTKRIDNGDPGRPDFFESAHLEGDTDMVETIGCLLQEEARRKSQGRSDWQIPMRPDHGQELLTDLAGNTMPGYPLIGRMRGLAELRGIMAALSD